ncbi:MAG: TlpA disulfide reductase family protein [Balneolaceae bacterium]|nr:TlpA disulfide reductase family protein [Balneolaceae bacterium]
MPDKRWLGFLVALVVFAAVSFTVKNNVRNNPGLAFGQGETLESFTLPDTTGTPVELQAYIEAHELTWVNFWATWCGPCRQEMPLMAKLYEEHSADGFGIVAISVSEEPQTVKTYLNQNPVPFTILLDEDGSVSQRYRVQALPTSFLVDSTGQVLQTGVGFQQSWEYVVNQRMGDN